MKELLDQLETERQANLGMEFEIAELTEAAVAGESINWQTSCRECSHDMERCVWSLRARE